MEKTDSYELLSIWLDFLEAVIGHVAWPLGVVLCLALFRSQIIRLLASMKKLSFGGAEASWEEDAVHVVEGARASGAELDIESVKSIAPDDLQLTILQSWSAIEETISRWVDAKLAELGVFDTEHGSMDLRLKNANLRHRNPRQDLSILARNEVISSEQKMTLDDLRTLRNKAAHASDFTLEAEKALQLAASIGSIRKQLDSSLRKFDLSGKQLIVN